MRKIDSLLGDLGHLISWNRFVSFIDRHEKIVLPLPGLILVISMLAFPLAYTVYLSFHKWFASSLQLPVWIGLENFRIMLTAPRFHRAVLQTLYFVSLSLGSQIFLGILIAGFLSMSFKGRGITRTLFTFPMMATPVAIALVWKMLMDPTIGALNYFLSLVNLPPSGWVSSARTVIPSLALVDTWHWTPLVTLIILAGFSALPREPYESAIIDGASRLRIFWHITLPLLRPAIMVAAMFRAIDCIKTFDIIMVISDGGPAFRSETINIYAFKQTFNYFHFGYGAAVLSILALTVFGISWIFIKLRRGEY